MAVASISRMNLINFACICRPSALRLANYSFPFTTSTRSVLFQVLPGRLTKARLGLSSMSSSSSPVLSEKQIQQVDRILEGKLDEHGGVIVEMTTDPLDPVVFSSLLKASLTHWRQEGRKGIWIKMPIELVNLVEPSVKEGFYFHHAEPKYLMLVNWLPSTANTLPANASHRVGIGAFVLNEKNEVLVVREKSGLFRRTGLWKFPTGVVDEGEDICDAAIREVNEETGIDAKFLEVLAFRQSHKSYFEKSDLFFVCMLQPLSSDFQIQETEIEEAKWMPFEEYRAQPLLQSYDLMRKVADICSAKIDKVYCGFAPIPTITGFSKKKAMLYANSQSLDLS